MSLEDRKKDIPEEFKQLAQDFSASGFITTSINSLYDIIDICKVPFHFSIIKDTYWFFVQNCICKNSESLFFFIDCLEFKTALKACISEV